MEHGLYVALSSQLALESQLNTIADNMANANTVGFRATAVKFEKVLSGLGENSVAFASAGDTYIPALSGAMRETGNSFDFAIRGDAWFAIDTPGGQVMTRDGRFTMLDTGDLVTLEGYPVLDAGGAPIQLDPQGGPPEAGQDGSLRQNGALLGAIGLYEFDPGANFRRYGNSGLLANDRAQPLVDRPDIGVVQGFVEDSNVNPVGEMMRLIQVQRNFEYIASLIKEGENAIDGAVRTLGSSTS